MSTISTAIGTERKARVAGYKIRKLFSENTTNLPQHIAIIGEANTANQAGLSTDAVEVTSAQEAGELFGFGSPIYAAMRILRPVGADGVGGIPTTVFPQISDAGATASTVVITVTGAATKNATHSISVAGRTSLDLQSYDFSVVIGDTPTIIAGKIKDAVNSVLGSPFTAANAAGVLTLTTKWEGATSAAVKAQIVTGLETAGITYAQTAATAGAGTVDLAASLSQFGTDWITTVVNTYGTAQLTQLEQFNGKPDNVNPTGRFVGNVFKPFIAFFGSVLDDKDDLAAITDAALRVQEQTNVLCPAPLSQACPWEAAANAVAIYARIAQDTPHLDVANNFYPDMPVPSNNVIGDLSDYNNRDFLVKKGCSTVTIKDGKYLMEDFVTTYHPDGEIQLQYAYIRNLNIDFNIAFGYKALEEVNVKDHTLVLDTQITTAEKTIKPREWKAIVFEYIDDLGIRALLKNTVESKASLRVQISEINTDRFETNFSYKRTGTARIVSTDVQAGF